MANNFTLMYFITFYGPQNITFLLANKLIFRDMFKYSFIFDFLNENECSPGTSIQREWFSYCSLFHALF